MLINKRCCQNAKKEINILKVVAIFFCPYAML